MDQSVIVLALGWTKAQATTDSLTWNRPPLHGHPKSAGRHSQHFGGISRVQKMLRFFSGMRKETLHDLADLIADLYILEGFLNRRDDIDRD